MRKDRTQERLCGADKTFDLQDQGCWFKSAEIVYAWVPNHKYLITVLDMTQTSIILFPQDLLRYFIHFMVVWNIYW